MESPRFKLNQEDIAKSRKWALIFLAPLALLYLGSVQATLLTVGHRFELKDLIPNQIIVGGMVLYVVERAYDLILRWSTGSSPVKDQPIERAQPTSER